MAFLCLSKSTAAVCCSGLVFVCDSDARNEMRRIGPGSENKNQQTVLQTLCADFSPCGRFLAFCTNLKELFVFSAANWSLLCSFKLEKQATATRFAYRTNNPITDVPQQFVRVLLADRAGNVTEFSLDNETEGSIENTVEGMRESSDDDDDEGDIDASKNGDKGRKRKRGKVILGHVSMLLDLLVSSDQRHVITCDRDEKIRVSRYPNAYNIECFCLGHKSYIKSIGFLSMSSSAGTSKSNMMLVSASGDGTICFWNYATGECLKQHQISGKSNNSKAVNSETHLDIRKIACCTKNCLVAVGFENTNIVQLLKIKIVNEELDIESMADLNLSMGCLVWDLVFDCSGNLWTLERCKDPKLGSVKVPPLAMYSWDSDNGDDTLVKTSIDNWTDDLLTALKDARIELPSLEKVVSFGNVETYIERKRARIENEERKQSKKKEKIGKAK